MSKPEIRVLEFTCQHPLSFLNHCEACAKHYKCKERALLLQILLEKGKLVFEEIKSKPSKSRGEK